MLDNLAMVRQDPAALPYFSLTPKGIVTIQETDGGSAGVNWDYAFLGTAGKFLNHADKKNLGVSATQQTVGQWQTESALDPDDLYLMRCAYQSLLGCQCPDCDKELAHYFEYNKARLEAALRPGWFGAGRRKDVPHGACHVGHYGDSYVWVTPEGMDGLSAFTLVILDIVTTLAPKPDPHVVQLGEMQQRLTALNTIWKGLPDAQSPEGKRLKAEIDALLGQYNVLLDEHLKEKPVTSDLFLRIRKEFHDSSASPNVVPAPP